MVFRGQTVHAEMETQNLRIKDAMMSGDNLVGDGTWIPTVNILLVEGLDPAASVRHVVGDALVGHYNAGKIASQPNWCHWRREDRGRRHEDCT
jgi:hypothetical protein